MRYVIFALVTTAIVYIFAMLVRRGLLERRFWAAFRSVFGEPPRSPSFEIKYFYGSPAFQITFPTKEAFEASVAQGLDAEFKKAISELCGHHKHFGDPFDPDKAVFFTYTGQNFEYSLPRYQAERDRWNGK